MRRRAPSAWSTTFFREAPGRSRSAERRAALSRYSSRRMISPATPDDADAIWNIFQKVVAGRDTYTFLPDTPRDEAVAYWLSATATRRHAELPGRLARMHKLIENKRGLGAHL